MARPGFAPLASRVAVAVNPTTLVLVAFAFFFGGIGLHVKPATGIPAPQNESDLYLQFNVPVDQPSSIRMRFDLSEEDLGSGSYTSISIYIDGSAFKLSGQKWSVSASLPPHPDNRPLESHPDSPATDAGYSSYTVIPDSSRSNSASIYTSWTNKRRGMVTRDGSYLGLRYPAVHILYRNSVKIPPKISADYTFTAPAVDEVIDSGPPPSSEQTSSMGKTWTWSVPYASEGPQREVDSRGNWVVAPLTYSLAGLEVPLAHSVTGDRKDRAAEFLSGIFLGLGGAALLGGAQECMNALFKMRRPKVDPPAKVVIAPNNLASVAEQRSRDVVVPDVPEDMLSLPAPRPLRGDASVWTAIGLVMIVLGAVFRRRSASRITK
jgi:hypothetical protein